jgi:anaerobic ribonucleoside-triphosphate reductase activating protein
MMHMREMISLARVYYPVKVLGPGSRVGIWLNGCHRKCPGCISPELQGYDLSKEVSVQDVIKMIMRIDSPIDGFTISGGEPFYNPKALNALVSALATICDDILIFTGYTLEELRQQDNESIYSILNTCSAIIDGPFVKELNERKGLRGSSNQRCWVFKHHNRYAGILEEERSLQNVLYDKGMLTIGIP